VDLEHCTAEENVVELERSFVWVNLVRIFSYGMFLGDNGRQNIIFIG
jgi:hypothetical protein